MIDADVNLQKDLDSCGSLPQAEDTDSIDPLPQYAGLFNQGSQDTLHDETRRSAAFGGGSFAYNSFT